MLAKDCVEFVSLFFALQMGRIQHGFSRKRNGRFRVHWVCIGICRIVEILDESELVGSLVARRLLSLEILLTA